LSVQYPDIGLRNRQKLSSLGPIFAFDDLSPTGSQGARCKLLAIAPLYPPPSQAWPEGAPAAGRSNVRNTFPYNALRLTKAAFYQHSNEYGRIWLLNQ
jgi:hypothetical protein